MTARRDLLFAASTVLAVLLLGWLYYQQAPLGAGLDLDAFHHMAAVRELARGEFPPRHNLIEGVHPQGHYGPYLVALGALACCTGADPIRLLYAAGVVNLFLFLLAFRLVAFKLFGPGPARWSALAPLLLWGPWPGRVVVWSSRAWPGTTSLADPHNFFYPHQAGLVLLLLVLALVLPGRGEGSAAHPNLGEPKGRPARLWKAVLALLLTAALIASHALTALALAAALLALAMSELLTHEATPRRLGLLLALPPTALLLASLWPYYPVLGLLRAFIVPGVRDPARSIFSPGAAAVGAVATASPVAPPPLSFAAVLGPALVGLLACLVLTVRRRPFLLCWVLIDLLLASLPWLPLRQRFVFFAALPLQLAASALLESAWKRGWVGRALAVAVLTTGALSAAQRIHWLLGQEAADLAFVERLTPPDAVVLSDPATSNGVAGLAGRKVVVPQNPDLFLVMGGGWQRMLDVERFLHPQASPEHREAILRRWRVSHVLIDRLGRSDPGRLPYPVVYEGGGYVLYETRNRARSP